MVLMRGFMRCLCGVYALMAPYAEVYAGVYAVFSFPCKSPSFNIHPKGSRPSDFQRCPQCPTSIKQHALITTAVACVYAQRAHPYTRSEASRGQEHAYAAHARVLPWLGAAYSTSLHEKNGLGPS